MPKTLTLLQPGSRWADVGREGYAESTSRVTKRMAEGGFGVAGADDSMARFEDEWVMDPATGMPVRRRELLRRQKEAATSAAPAAGGVIRGVENITRQVGADQEYNRDFRQFDDAARAEHQGRVDDWQRASVERSEGDRWGLTPSSGTQGMVLRDGQWVPTEETKALESGPGIAGVASRVYDLAARDLPYMKKVQDAVGDIAEPLGESVAGVLDPTGAGRRLTGLDGGDVGRFVGEGIVPTNTVELGLELLPGIGTVPGVTSAIRNGAGDAVRRKATQLIRDVSTPQGSSWLPRYAAGIGGTGAEDELLRFAREAGEEADQIAKPLPGQAGMFGEVVDEAGAIKLPPPELGSMKDEAFRGEQGGMQPGMFTREESGSRPGQMGLEESLRAGETPPPTAAAPPPQQAPAPGERSLMKIPVKDIEFRPSVFQARDADEGLAFTEKRVNEIVRAWDDAQFIPPSVVPDPQRPGKFIAYVGHHRTEAFRRVKGDDSLIDAMVVNLDVSDIDALKKIQLEADASNFTTAIPNFRESIRASRRAQELGATVEDVADRLRMTPSQVDALNDAARLGDQAIDRVVTEPALEPYIKELGRGMRAFGINVEDANGWFNRIANAKKGSRPTAAALRETVDRFGAAFAELSQDGLFDTGQFAGMRSGILGLIDENARVRTELQKAINQAKREQKAARNLGAGVGAKKADKAAADRLIALAQKNENALRAKLGANEEDLAQAIRSANPPPAATPTEAIPASTIEPSPVAAMTPAEPETELARQLRESVEQLQGKAPASAAPQTPFDTPEIIAVRNEQLGQPPTSDIISPERQQLRRQVADDLYGTGAAKKERRADLVLGPPAAGKSRTLAEPLANDYGALIIDADAAKEMLPEFDGGRFAGRVHQESSDIADRVLARAVLNGDNMVLPYVGKNADRMLTVVQRLKEEGYTVYVHLVELPADKAAQRAVTRYADSGRFVDPAYVIAIGDSPMRTYDRIKAEGIIDGYSRWSNDVPKGTSPNLLESSGADATPLGGRAGEGPSGRVGGGAREDLTEPQGQALPAEEDDLAEELGFVTRSDGTVVKATPEEIDQAVRRFFSRGDTSGAPGPTINITRQSTPAEVADAIYEALATARTRGGRALFQNVDEVTLREAVATYGDRLEIVPYGTGSRGRMAVRVADGGTLRPNALQEAIRRETATDGATALKPAEGLSGPRLQLPADDGAKQPNLGIKIGPNRDPYWRQVARFAGDIITVIPRALQTGFDYSYPFRQGGLLIRHQKEFWSNFAKGLRALADEKYARKRMAQILAAPYNPSTLDLTHFEKGTRFTDREEDFLSRLASSIPGIKEAGRAATVFINGIRSDVANTFARTQLRHGAALEQIQPMLDVYGNYLNRATGRGNLGQFEDSVGLLNQVFYGARRNVAMVQVPGYLFNTNATIRKEVWLDFVTFFGVGAATLKIAELAGAEVGLDPFAADFGKIRVGNTRVDIFGGYLQMARLMAKIIDGQIDHPGQLKEGDFAAIMQFLGNKLSPHAGVGADAVPQLRENFRPLAEPVTPGNLPERLLIPLAFSGLLEAIEEDGAMGGALALTGFFGTGVQSYSNAFEEATTLVQDEVDAGLLPETFIDAQGNEQPLTEYHQLTRAQQEAFNKRHPENAEMRQDSTHPAIQRLRAEQDVYRKDQEAIDNMPFGEDWRDARKSVLDQRRGALDAVTREHADYFAELDTREPTNLEDAVLRDFAAAIDSAKDPKTRQVNWDLVDREVASWSPQAQAQLEETRLLSGTAKEREYLKDVAKLEPYWRARDEQWQKMRSANQLFAPYETFDAYQEAFINQVKAKNPTVPAALLESSIKAALAGVEESLSITGKQYLAKNRELVALLHKHGYYVPAEYRALTPPAGTTIGATP